MVEYKEFRVGDLFKLVKKTALIKDFEKSLVETDVLSVPATSASSVNNMLTYWVNPDEHNCLYNMITIAANGSFGVACYQEGPFAISQDSYAIYCEKDTSKEAYMYMTACMNKRLIEYSYDRKAGWNRFKEDVISLPTTPFGTPDFDLMENYIKEVEQKHIEKLESDLVARTENLLTAIGREDLVGDPDGLVAVVDKGFDDSGVEYAEFRVGDLFDINPTKAYTILKDEEIMVGDETPFITTTVSNNGIRGYSDLEPLNKGNSLTASDTTTSDAIFYQADDYIGRSHVQGLHPKFKGFNKAVAMYILTAFRKSADGLYDYGTKFNRDKMRATTIKLPITPSGTPDFDFMERYIAHIELKFTHTDAMDENERIAIIKELVE